MKAFEGENRFSDCDGIEELVGQLVGAGSMCWENVAGAGVFDSREAARTSDDGVRRLSEILGSEVTP